MGRLTVLASGVLLLSALISLAIANMSPEILNQAERLCEDIPKDGYAFTIRATDREGDTLRYGISGSNRFFNVDPVSGVVTIKSPLDREANNKIIVELEVSDDFNTAHKSLTIILLDANDNSPIFTESSYNVNVNENKAVGSELFKVSATDVDLGAASAVKYSIDEVIPTGGERLFAIEDRSGMVKLQQALDYNSLSTFYRLKINASDGGSISCTLRAPLSTVTYGFITVVDIPNLPPRFLMLPYRDSVKEGSPLGTEVLTVTAIDQDTGVNDVIRYSIEGQHQPITFGISQSTGVITVVSEIDRETIGDTIELRVKAAEMNPNIHGEEASIVTDVLITILDVNDNTPLFYSCGITTCELQTQFRGEIFENSAGTLQINMTVRDLDQNGQIRLEVHGVDKDAFSVAPSDTVSKSTVQLVVRNSELLDFETKEEMVVEVVAIDKENTAMRSTATVTIQILDTNDNSPIFPMDRYRLSLPEHSADNTEVALITAEDLDKMDQGNLTYRLLPASIHKYFNVDMHTGRVFVANSTLIDREAMSLYSATLQARDTKNNIGTTELEITLTDINDHPPKINRESANVFVQEGQPLRLKIEATDADDPETLNSKIVFAIEPSKYSNNFTIDPNTGVLTNRMELDRDILDPKEKGQIELNVTATDQGMPSLMTVVNVIINIEDINDNDPIFKEASYDFSVKEGAKGVFVGSVAAVDLDQVLDFNRISFSIIDGSFGSFIIRTFADGVGYRGNITVDPDIELDYERLPNKFTLRVEAADLAQRRTEVTVKVKVLDINDERPEFLPSGPLEVMENSKVTGALGQFSAVDKDSIHHLVYHMESCECRCKVDFEPCDWLLVDSMGNITVNPDATLDYEQCDQVRVEAQVVDVHTEKGENNSVSAAVMVVNLLDINDNTPEFIISDTVIVLVSEIASMGTSIAQVTAMDRDSTINAEIEFKVTEMKFKDINSQISIIRPPIFEAVTTQQKDFFVGIIQSTEEPESTRKGKYLVTVNATDNGGLSNSTELEIFIIDISFKVQLQFGLPVADVLRSKESITLALSAATNAAVYVVAVKEDTAGSRALGDSLMESYFVYHNGSALLPVLVENKLSEPNNFILLAQYKLNNVGNVIVVPEAPDTEKYLLLGLVGGLIIVLTVLTTSLVCTRRSYQTKLKAAKAMKSTVMDATENQRGGPIVPGTNKYTMEGANPVLNLNIDTVTDLGFEEESSNTDRISVNSFGDSMSLNSEKDRTMMVIQEEDEESIHIEPLGAALAQRANKQEAGSSQVGFTNPAFSTTDL